MSAEDRFLDAETKAAVLIESLPWMQRFAGKTVVVKFGGNAMVDEDLKRAFAEDMVYLRHAGLRPVVVHGGGPQISAALTARGIPSDFRGGLRVTTPEVMAVVREVLENEVNAELIDLVNEHGEYGVGLSAAAQVFAGRRRDAVVNGQPVDLGLVGDVVEVDAEPIVELLDDGMIPIITSVAIDLDVDGQTLNVNADSAAASLASALGATKLVILTDVEGLYSDWPDRTSLVSHLTTAELGELLPSLESGMIPKMSACLEAVAAGVEKAAIIDGRIPHSILLEIFTTSGIGTEVVPA